MGGRAATVLIASIAASAVGGGLAWRAHQSYTLKIGYYGPRKAPVVIATPLITMEAWNEQGYPVTGTKMTVDGKAVPASYDTESKALSYRPESPLGPGPHRVEVAITLDRQATFPKAWDVTVAPDAIAALPEPSAEAREAAATANDLRKGSGLEPLALDPILSAVAGRHAEYMSENRASGHEQVAGKPGFFGRTTDERLSCYGWPGGSYEGVTEGEGGAAESVTILFTAPYHRVPFLQPGPVAFGSGYRNGKATVMFGLSKKTSVVLSPGEDATGVTPIWNGAEEPNPLRMHDHGGGPTGYPVMLTLWKGKAAPITSASATMETGGEKVAIYVNHPGNDPALTNGVVVIPAKPLKPKTTYKVEVRYTPAGGDPPATRVWSFTTA